MLMITSIEEGVSTRILRLEVKLQAPWVQVLRAACDAAESTRPQTCLDLADLRFVDTMGVECLHELIRGDIPLIECSGFFGSLLDIEP